MGQAVTMRDAIVAAVQTGCNTGIGIEDRCRFPECLCALSIEYMATIRAFLEAAREPSAQIQTLGEQEMWQSVFDYTIANFNAAAKDFAK